MMVSTTSQCNPFPISITYTMKEKKAEPAPTIMVQISSSTGTRYIEVLPDSGADISTAGQGKTVSVYYINLQPVNY